MIRMREKLIGAAATVLSLVTIGVVLVLALRILFTAVSVNGHSGVVQWVTHASDRLAWGFKNIFTPKNHKTAVLANYGSAALVYLIAGQVLVKLLRRM
jgi:hypothetical protein